MTITITAFERSPDGGRGLARDTRVRWALEEVGQPYEVRLVSFRAMKEPAHLASRQSAALSVDICLFECGSSIRIVLLRLPYFLGCKALDPRPRIGGYCLLALADCQGRGERQDSAAHSFPPLGGQTRPQGRTDR
jgi:hypothetical protein